jgi:hypothetical protein
MSRVCDTSLLPALRSELRSPVAAALFIESSSLLERESLRGESSKRTDACRRCRFYHEQPRDEDSLIPDLIALIGEARRQATRTGLRALITLVSTPPRLSARNSKH